MKPCALAAYCNFFTVYYIMLIISTQYLVGAYYEYIEWFRICFLIIGLSPEPSTPWVQMVSYLEVKASSSVTLTPVTQLIKDLYLPAEISLRFESLQVLIGVCSHMCLYLLSTTISTNSGYTLKTAINFQSLLDTSLLLQTSRDLSVSDSHTLSANTSSCESRHLRVVAEHCRWRTGPLLLAELSGVVWWSVVRRVLSPSVPKHPSVLPCRTQFLLEVLFLVFVFTCNPLPPIFLSWYSTGLLQGEGGRVGRWHQMTNIKKGWRV